MLLAVLALAAHVLVAVIWPPVHWLTWLYYAVFFVTVQLLGHFLPGRVVVGIPYASGERSRHKNNGPAVVFSVLLLFLTGTYIGLWPGDVVYQHIGDVVTVSGVFSVALMIVSEKEVKGKATKAKEGRGRMRELLDGVEGQSIVLPGGLRFDGLEQLRTGMSGLLLACLSLAFHQYQREVVEGFLQTPPLYFGVPLVAFLALVGFYVGDRMVYEQEECSSVVWFTARRTGVARMWLALVGVPVAGSFPAWWLIGDPREGLWPPLLLLAVGVFGVGYAFWRGGSRQKHVFRTRGPAGSVWGQRPLVIEAVKQAEELEGGVPQLPGMGRRRVLLVCGYWAIVRHPRAFGTIFMALGTAILALPALWPLLLPLGLYCGAWGVAREAERRYEAQYGPVWRRYCSMVPRQLLPEVL